MCNLVYVLKESSSRECSGRAWAEAGTGAAPRVSPVSSRPSRFSPSSSRPSGSSQSSSGPSRSFQCSSRTSRSAPASLRPLYLSPKYTRFSSTLSASLTRSMIAGTHSVPGERQTILEIYRRPKRQTPMVLIFAGAPCIKTPHRCLQSLWRRPTGPPPRLEGSSRVPLHSTCSSRRSPSAAQWPPSPTVTVPSSPSP